MLKGKKIELHGVSECHLEQLREWRNNPNLRMYFREHREITPEMQKEWWAKASKDPNQYNFEIHVDGTLIGFCGLYYIDWVARKAEFGIYIGDQNYRGQGYGSDALRTLVKYGFNTLNLNKIWCEVYANNRSIEVYKRLGFQLEGTLKETYYDSGKWWDSHLLALFQLDWQVNEKFFKQMAQDIIRESERKPNEIQTFSPEEVELLRASRTNKLPLYPSEQVTEEGIVADFVKCKTKKCNRECDCE